MYSFVKRNILIALIGVFPMVVGVESAAGFRRRNRADQADQAEGMVAVATETLIPGAGRVALIP